MKSSLTVLVAAIVGLFIVVGFEAKAQNLIPMIGNSNIQVQISGYTHVYYLPDSATCPKADRIGLPDDGSDSQWGLCRIRLNVKSSTPLGFFSEIEAVDLDHSKENWLREAKISYKVNDDWSLYAGRIFIASGWVTPSPANIETVRYPRMPFTCYAYAVQAQGNLGGGMSIASDISGKSGVSFDSDENFDQVESSTRLKKEITKNLFLAGMVQMSRDFGGFVLDSEYHIDKLCLRGAGYTKYELTNEAKDTKGFYTFTSYQVLTGVEIHTQYDHQNGGNDIWTVGTRLWAPKDQISLTVDYEYVPHQNDDSRVVARAEVRF